MSHFEGPSSLREETNANNNPSSLYRELKNIRISDKKKGVGIQSYLATCVPGARRVCYYQKSEGSHCDLQYVSSRCSLACSTFFDATRSFLCIPISKTTNQGVSTAQEELPTIQVLRKARLKQSTGSEPIFIVSPSTYCSEKHTSVTARFPIGQSIDLRDTENGKSSVGA